MSAGYCDGCGQDRRDVRACGRDSNGDPDAPCLCFFCRKTVERGGTLRRRDDDPTAEDISAAELAWCAAHAPDDMGGG